MRLIGAEVRALGFDFEASAAGAGLRCRRLAEGFRVQGARRGVKGLGFRARASAQGSGLRFRVLGFKV